MKGNNPTVLLITGKNKDGVKEDIFLAEYLRKEFEVIVSNMLNAERLANKADLVLIRNIWPTSPQLTQDKEILKRLMKRRIPLYNPGVHEEDLIGKAYLVELFKKGFPAIPTIDKKPELLLLGNTHSYFIKPKHGGSREGCKKIKSSQIHSVNFNKFVIQPFIDFEYEISFYFIDNRFQYALYAPDKKKRWSLRPIEVSRAERAFAQQFVDWNALPYGIQRIDAIRMKNKDILLNEIEDWCPYLSLLDTPKILREKLLKNLVKSLQGVVRK